jgi:hypothetical protein
LLPNRNRLYKAAEKLSSAISASAASRHYLPRATIEGRAQGKNINKIKLDHKAVFSRKS